MQLLQIQPSIAPPVDGAILALADRLHEESNHDSHAASGRLCANCIVQALRLAVAVARKGGAR